MSLNKETHCVAAFQHLYTFWHDLQEQEQKALADQIQALDPAHIQDALAAAVKSSCKAGHPDPLPVSADKVNSVADTPPADIVMFRQIGLDAVRRGKVAVVHLAGGQGTRFGSSQPKGTVDFGLKCGKSLFHLHAESLKRVQVEAGYGLLHWYIMVSHATKAQTEAFFIEHGYFGLEIEQVHFFLQSDLPVFSMDGKILLQDKCTVAMSPAGNGSIFASLRDTGTLVDMRSRGIEALHVLGIDNCLAKVADPAFIGANLHRRTQVGVKVVAKEDPDECVGVMCTRNGTLDMMEYSEMPPGLAGLRDSFGRLVFGLANIVNHYFTLDFIESVCDMPLPYHVALKKVPHVDLKTGLAVVPVKPNAIKLERFIVDVFPYCHEFLLYQVARQLEFSPLKNATGPDSPETCCEHLSWQGIY